MSANKSAMLLYNKIQLAHSLRQEAFNSFPDTLYASKFEIPENQQRGLPRDQPVPNYNKLGVGLASFFRPKPNQLIRIKQLPIGIVPVESKYHKEEEKKEDEELGGEDSEKKEEGVEVGDADKDEGEKPKAERLLGGKDEKAKITESEIERKTEEKSDYESEEESEKTKKSPKKSPKKSRKSEKSPEISPKSESEPEDESEKEGEKSASASSSSHEDDALLKEFLDKATDSDKKTGNQAVYEIIIDNGTDKQVRYFHGKEELDKYFPFKKTATERTVKSSSGQTITIKRHS